MAAELERLLRIFHGSRRIFQKNECGLSSLRFLTRADPLNGSDCDLHRSSEDPFAILGLCRHADDSDPFRGTVTQTHTQPRGFRTPVSQIFVLPTGNGVLLQRAHWRNVRLNFGIRSYKILGLIDIVVGPAFANDVAEASLARQGILRNKR